MRFLKQQAEIINQFCGIQGIYQQIECAARTCYLSSFRGNSKDFVDKLIANKHYAMLEFGTVYLTVPKEKEDVIYFYSINPFSYCSPLSDILETGYLHITTNYRVIIENHRENDLQYLSDCTYHEPRITFRLTTSIGIARELTRHRVFSFAQESTRYCNYSTDRLGNEINFIIPYWAISIHLGDACTTGLDKKSLLFANNCLKAEEAYNNLIAEGASPQEAREVLPLSTKTVICMCGLYTDWIHFFELRYKGITGEPHPDMKALAEMMLKLTDINHDNFFDY